MKLRSYAIAITLVLLLPTVGRAGIVVVSHLPRQAGGPASDTDFLDSINFDNPSNQRLADNFSTSSSFSIQTVRWWGFYGGPGQSHDPPPGDETIRIRFYGARPGDGLPDDNNIVFEESFLNSSRTATGQIVFAEVDAPQFIFETDLRAPLSLSANTPYWMEIVQIGDVDSTFRLETSEADLDSFAFINNNVRDWTITATVDLAFELLSVPEPNSLCLVLVGLWIVASRRAHKKHNVKE